MFIKIRCSNSTCDPFKITVDNSILEDRIAPSPSTDYGKHVGVDCMTLVTDCDIDSSRTGLNLNPGPSGRDDSSQIPRMENPRQDLPGPKPIVQELPIVPRAMPKHDISVDDLSIQWSDLVLKERIGAGTDETLNGFFLVFKGQKKCIQHLTPCKFQVLLALSTVLIGMARYVYLQIFLMVDLYFCA